MQIAETIRTLNKDSVEVDERQKYSGFLSKNNGSARSAHVFLCNSLEKKDVKWLNFRIFGGREHNDQNFLV